METYLGIEIPWNVKEALA